jgi:predicted RNA methylase
MKERSGLREALRLARIIRTHAEMFGVFSAVRFATAHLLTRLPLESPGRFDERYGTTTSEWIPVEQARLPEDAKADAVIYGPTLVATMHHVLRKLPVKHQEFEVVDLGSGRGRAVLMASDYPFARITGVELSPVHSRIARENLEKYRASASARMRCKDIVLVEGSVLDFVIPDANVVFFLFNPFVGSVFDRCMERIHLAADSRPNRKTYLAYVNPWVKEEWLAATGYFVRVAEFRVIPPMWSWSLWMHKSGMAPPGLPR